MSCILCCRFCHNRMQIMTLPHLDEVCLANIKDPEVARHESTGKVVELGLSGQVGSAAGRVVRGVEAAQLRVTEQIPHSDGRVHTHCAELGPAKAASGQMSASSAQTSLLH